MRGIALLVLLLVACGGRGADPPGARAPDAGVEVDCEMWMDGGVLGRIRRIECG